MLCQGRSGVPHGLRLRHEAVQQQSISRAVSRGKAPQHNGSRNKGSSEGERGRQRLPVSGSAGRPITDEWAGSDLVPAQEPLACADGISMTVCYDLWD